MAARPRRRDAILPALLILIGIGVLLFPVVRVWVNDYQQQQAITHYTPPDDASAEALINSASAYNSRDPQSYTALNDPWGAAPLSDGQPARDLPVHPGDAIGTITMPDLGIYLPLAEGTTENELSRGAGHLIGTSLPVGGLGTHSTIAAHTAFRGAAMFDNLLNAREGMLFHVNAFGRESTYKVDDIKVVLPNDSEALNAIPDRDLVTLLTCTPYGENSHRLLVRGERVPDSPAVAESHGTTEAPTTLSQRFTIQEWMRLPLIASGVLLVALIAWIAWFMGMARRARHTHSTSR